MTGYLIMLQPQLLRIQHKDVCAFSCFAAAAAAAKRLAQVAEAQQYAVTVVQGVWSYRSKADRTGTGFCFTE